MAGFLELIDNTLGTHFNAPVYKPEDGRKKLIRVIDKAAEQHSQGKTPPTRSWKAGTNNAISFSPKIDGKPVKVGGTETNYVPAERFQDFLSGMKAAVAAGELDKEIKAALESTPAAGAPEASTKPTRTGARAARSPIANLRTSVSRSANNGKSLKEIEAVLKASGKYDAADIDAVIAEKRAAK